MVVGRGDSTCSVTNSCLGQTLVTPRISRGWNKLPRRTFDSHEREAAKSVAIRIPLACGGEYAMTTWDMKMAFIRRQAGPARGHGVVLWDDWDAAQSNVEQPHGEIDTIPSPGPETQALISSSSPTRVGARGNNRARAAHAAMMKNLTTPTNLRIGRRPK